MQFADLWAGLLGGGKIAMAGNAQIVGSTQSYTYLENVNDTIKGYGSIGNGVIGTPADGLSLNNDSRGVINASGAAGQVLTINTGSHSIYNDGLIESTGAGGLQIYSQLSNDGMLEALGTGAVTLHNSQVQGPGSVTVAAGSTIKLNNSGFNYLGGGVAIGSAAVNGGKIATTSGDSTDIGSSNVLVGDYLNSTITNYGTIKVADNSTLNLSNNVFNRGTGRIFVDGASDKTTLELYQYGASVEGGQIVLSDSLNNAIVSNGTAMSLNTNADISGSGVIGDGWLQLNLAMGGIVNSNGAAGLTLEGNTLALQHGGFENNSSGLIETTGAGGMTINGELNNNGAIEADGLGALTLNGAVIQGSGSVDVAAAASILLEHGSALNYGSVSVATGGMIATAGGDTGSNADTINGMTSNAGTIKVVGGSDLLIGSDLMNSGQVIVNGTTKVAALEIDNGLTLGDGGVILLNGPNASLISYTANTFLDIQSQTIMGSGVIGDSNTNITNASGGVIDATGAGGLTVSAQSLTNTGVIESNSSGGLKIVGGLFNGGELIANTGGNMSVTGSVSGAGIVEINGSGNFEIGGAANSAMVFGAGGSGDLILDNSAQSNGQIVGFAAGDTVDLRDFAFTSQDAMQLAEPGTSIGPTDGNVQITNGVALSNVFWFEGNYTAANLAAEHLKVAFSDDMHKMGANGPDGTLVTLVSTQ